MALRGAEYVRSSAKRSLDMSGGLLLAAGSSPVAAAMALETCVEHRKLNPFFLQTRLGKGGEEFSMYKFQSIRDHVPQFQMGGVHHPHASPVGRLIRTAGLDEVPQLLNVLKGDISLVGIRPMPAETLEAYREAIDDEELFDEWQVCYAQNPGLTGEGQLYGRHHPNHDDPSFIRRRLEIDVESFHDASLANDIRTLGRTPLALLQSTAQLSVSVVRQQALSFWSETDTI